MYSAIGGKNGVKLYYSVLLLSTTIDSPDMTNALISHNETFSISNQPISNQGWTDLNANQLEGSDE